MTSLQEQYPLSPKKFWKKYLFSLIAWVIIWAFVSGVSSLLMSGVYDPSLRIDFTLALMGWTIVVGGGLLLYAWYISTYIKRYFYDANDAFVTIKKGVFAPTEIHVQYTKIQDVYVDQDILDRIMGLYDVHIASATATSGIEAHIDGVEQPAAEGLKEFLLAKIQGHPTGPANSAAGVSSSSTSPMPPVQLSEEISSKTYPLNSSWMAQQIVMYFFSSAFLAALLSFYASAPRDDSTTTIANTFGFSFASACIVLFIVIYVFHIVYAILWRSTYSFAFLPEYIVMRTGVIGRSEVHVPYHTIQDVVVSQGIVERVFGLATTKIQNAAGSQVVGRNKIAQSGINIPGQSLDRANHLSNVVKNILGTRDATQTGL